MEHVSVHNDDFSQETAQSFFLQIVWNKQENKLPLQTLQNTVVRLIDSRNSHARAICSPQ